MHLLLGLGNPGGQYEKTRHNVGFLVADQLACRGSTILSKRQFGALVGKVRLGSQVMVAAKPQSFMNLSGQPAASLRGFYKIPVDRMIVIHDELDLPFGQVRVKKGGGHGGHNGLRDLQKRAGGNGFLRVRVGISRPPPEWNVADYVLARWTPEEQSRLDDIVHTAADAVEAVVREGVDAAMNRFNVRPERGRRNSPVGTADSI